MFSIEIGSMDMIDKAVDEYELHFEQVFPLYEYTEMTKNDEYDFSVEGAKKLVAFITQRISENKPVEVPEGYEDRVY